MTADKHWSPVGATQFSGLVHNIHRLLICQFSRPLFGFPPSSKAINSIAVLSIAVLSFLHYRTPKLSPDDITWCLQVICNYTLCSFVCKCRSVKLHLFPSVCLCSARQSHPAAGSKSWSCTWAFLLDPAYLFVKLYIKKIKSWKQHKNLCKMLHYKLLLIAFVWRWKLPVRTDGVG